MLTAGFIRATNTTISDHPRAGERHQANTSVEGGRQKQTFETTHGHVEVLSRQRERRVGRKRRPRQFLEGERVLIKLRSDQLRDQNNKSQRLVRKYYGSIEVIHKIGKTSYRIQLLRWMRTNLVVHVSNMKRYSPDLEDVKHREATRPHTKKKNPHAKGSRRNFNWGDNKSQRTNKQFSTIPNKFEETPQHRVEARRRDLKSSATYNIELSRDGLQRRQPI